MNSGGVKTKKYGIINIIYLIIAIGAVVAFLIIFKIDQLVRCSRIESNDKYQNILENLYVPKSISDEDLAITLSAYDEAIKRNTSLFGQLVGEPIIIITRQDDEAIGFRGNYVGATHNSVFGLYVIIGPDGLNEDILSHELAHSELSARVGWYKTNKIPIWFNEGIATQVDYRSDYSLERWNVITNNGKNIVEVKEFVTPAEFYNSDFELQVNNYTLAKQEVTKWLDLVGSDGLNKLIDAYNDGEDLYTIYTNMLLEESQKLHK